ncbi:MAG: riboflavin synthase [Candidatus Margulisbacteria bacterium]|jgi:riboflavin synthase|nr:riboflavin synthase [Candidatus Margulisiibacteriota bacterium]
MFTGIVEQIGVVASFIRTQNSAKLVVSAGKYFDDLKPGDSVAVNGACLTATQCRRGFAEFDVSNETIKRSALIDLKISDKVNLEKALPIGGRLGGHLVTGHIDGTAEVRNRTKNGEGFDLWLSIPSDLLRYLVAKGSIAVDGASLTVADFRDSLLKVTVIPHTSRHTTLTSKAVGDRVNIEVDLISKYIEKHLMGEPRGVSDEMMMRLGIMPLGGNDNN